MAEVFLTLAILLQLADGWTTWRLLSNGGRELNPAMAFLIDKLGLAPALVLAKSAFVALLVGATQQGSVPDFVLALIVIAYTMVVAANVKEMCG